MASPDVIFIVLDTLRADRLGCYGNARAITPNMDVLAGEGALFAQAVSPAQWTIPSHASLFTGLYPTGHGVTQYQQRLSPDIPTLAEVVHAQGYETVGVSNNGLIGVFPNGLTRGFETFYNYGGATPERLRGSYPSAIEPILDRWMRLVARISYPIQSYLSQSDLALRLLLTSWATPVWSRVAHTKGQNERSVADLCRFLRRRDRKEPARPLFLFLNLMETHLPLWPPRKYIERVSPGLIENRRAQEIMRAWRRDAYRWEAPLDPPLTEDERRVIDALYNAEVAYQDQFLGDLFSLLRERARSEETLTILVSDHGQGLGEHGFFGHSFVAYQELVHVPLVIHWPDTVTPSRIQAPVSTRRVFHTVLDAVGSSCSESTGLSRAAIQEQSLLGCGDDDEHHAYTEIYPALHSLKVMQRRQPDMIDELGIRSVRRALVHGGRKLIRIDGVPKELYDLRQDPQELNNLSKCDHRGLAALNELFDRDKEDEMCRVEERAATRAEIIEEKLMKRLRDLGYID